METINTALSYLKSIFKFLLFTNIYLGICVTGLTFAFDSGTFMLKVFTFFSTVAVYSILRIRVIKYETRTLSAYASWLKENVTIAKAIRDVSTVITVMTFAYLDRVYQIGFLSLGCIWILYNLPIFSGGRIKFGLRYIWFIKPFVVGLIVAGTVVSVPLLTGGADIFHICMATLVMGSLASALVVIFEIKDMDIDRTFHTDTIPIRIGVSGTKVIAAALLLLSAIITFLYFHEASVTLTLLKVLPFISLAAFLSFFIRKDTNDYVYWLIIDGWMWLLGLTWYLINLHYIPIS